MVALSKSYLKMVDLSVIIPTYGRYEILLNTLRLLLQQDTQPLEIIVIDQTKDQNSKLKASLDNIVKENRVKYIYQNEPHANRARNRGIRESRGKILLFLDDDVVISSDFVSKHFINYENPLIAAISGQVLEYGSKPTDEFPRSFYRKYTGWIYFPLNFSQRTEVINLDSCNLSIRREIIMEAGGFDENFSQTYFDDTDLSLRAHKVCLKKGLKTIHDPRPSLIHLKAPGGNRPEGINEYVIADRYTWMTWLYFFLINFGIYASWEILLRLRSCVFRKVNILRPKYLCIAIFEFLVGLQNALRLIVKGRTLPFRSR